MPPKRAPLACNCEVVHIALARPNRALGDVRRAIGPASPKLSDPVPEKSTNAMFHTRSDYLLMAGESRMLCLPVNGHIVLDMVDNIHLYIIAFSRV